MVGRTLHKYAWDERQRRKGGSEVRVKGRDCIDRFSVLIYGRKKSRRLTIIIVPFLQTCCCRLL